MFALAALILVGFAMMTLGVALLFLGEAPFLAGKRIPAWRSRLIGGILASFLPLALVLAKLVGFLFPETVEPQAVTWLLFGFCWFLVFVILFRVMVPKREPHKPMKGAPARERKGAEKSPALEGQAAESLAWMEPNAEPAEPEPKPEPARKPAMKKPVAKKPAKPSAQDSSPFDFS